MKTIDLLVAVWVGAFLCGCTHYTKSDSASICIDLSSAGEDMVSSTMIDSVAYLSLETSDECLLGRIKNVTVIDSLFVILDCKRDAVLTFDFNGKFCHQIGSCGEGPREYIQATQIDVDHESKRIFIYDRIGSKVLVYDKNGRYLESIATLGLAFDFAHWKDDANNGFLFVNNRAEKEQSGIIRHDLNSGEIVQLLPRMNDFHSNGAYEFYHSNGDLYVAAPPFSNDVYKVSGDTLAPAFKLNVTPMPSQTDLDYGYTSQNMSSFLRLSFTKTSRWLMLNFWSGAHGSRQVRLDIASNKLETANIINDDISTYDCMDVFPICINDVEIGIAEADNPEDNPRLAFFYYKK